MGGRNPPLLLAASPTLTQLDSTRARRASARDVEAVFARYLWALLALALPTVLFLAVLLFRPTRPPSNGHIDRYTRSDQKCCRLGLQLVLIDSALGLVA